MLAIQKTIFQELKYIPQRQTLKGGLPGMFLFFGNFGFEVCYGPFTTQGNQKKGPEL